MRLRRSLTLSLRALFAHKVRASLALASVSAGVAAVILTSAIGAGAQRDIRQKIERMGVNLLVVRPVQVARSAARKEQKGVVTTLRLADYEAVAELSVVERAAPGIELPVKVKVGASAMATRLLGTTKDFPLVRHFVIKRGRFFDDADDRASRRVVVLGARVAETLFDDDPVGRQILIRRVPFDVIGVLAPKGALGDGDEDNQVLVPIRTVLRRVSNSTWLSTVFVSVREEGPRSINNAESQIGAVLRERHRVKSSGQPDFEVQNAARFFTMQRQTADSLGTMTTGLGAAALLVGGTGIMALMLLSVKERTSEIGLRIAVGATSRNILTQFLLESTILALSGWAGGILIGAAGVTIIGVSTAWPVAAPVPAMLGSLAMAVIIGVGFGAIPARKAAMIPPMQALLTH
jgi:putative ABC transport system permease protein